VIARGLAQNVLNVTEDWRCFARSMCYEKSVFIGESGEAVDEGLGIADWG
jgi:hypothetical protein